MNVVVNGVDKEMEPSATVLDIVRDVGTTSQRGVAVAVNGEVVPRGRWGGATLKEGDQVEVLRAIGGG